MLFLLFWNCVSPFKSDCLQVAKLHEKNVFYFLKGFFKAISRFWWTGKRKSWELLKKSQPIKQKSVTPKGQKHSVFSFLFSNMAFSPSGAFSLTKCHGSPCGMQFQNEYLVFITRFLLLNWTITSKVRYSTCIILYIELILKISKLTSSQKDNNNKHFHFYIS